MANQTWDTIQLQQDYEVLHFLAPFVVVIRKADGVRGTLTWDRVDNVRLYSDFQAEWVTA